MGDNRETEELVAGVLAGAATMFLSTCANDEPWSAGVFFVESDPFTIRLVVETTGRTLRNIHANPRVALVVSTGNPFEPFLQGAAEAVVEDDGQIAEIGAALAAKSPQIGPLLESGMAVAALRLDVKTWRYTDIPNGVLPGVEVGPSPARLG